MTIELANFIRYRPVDGTQMRFAKTELQLGRTVGNGSLQESGPLAWRKIHRYAFDDSQWVEADAREWYADWLKTLPCSTCSGGWAEITRIREIDFTSREGFQRTTIEAHDDVNEKLRGKEARIGVDRATKLWQTKYILWQPFHFGGLERWAHSLSSHLPGCGMVIESKSDFDIPLRESINATQMTLREAVHLDRPILMSCIHNADPWPKACGARVIAVVHGICDYTRNWVLSSIDSISGFVGVAPIVSEHVRTWTGRECTTIENGVDLERIKPTASKKELRARYGIPENAHVIGYAGRIAPEKQVDRLVEAMKFLPDSWLLIAGWQVDSKLSQWIDAAGIGDRTRVIPAVPHIGDVLGSIDVFCSPSRTEGFGLAVMEALVAGVPTVTTRTGIMIDLNREDYFAKLLDVDCSPESIAKACAVVRRSTLNICKFSSFGMAQRWQLFVFGQSSFSRCDATLPTLRASLPSKRWEAGDP